MTQQIKNFFFDLETTGVDDRKHGIHQIAGIVEVGGRVFEKFNIKLQPRPGCEIEDEALKIGGITRETLNTYIEFGQGFQDLTAILSKYVDRYDKHDKLFMVGYNVGFDHQFLRSFWLDNNDKWFGSLFWTNAIDVMTLASLPLQSVRREMPNFKLHSAATALGVPIDETKQHDAIYDIEVTRSMFYRCKEILSGAALCPRCNTPLGTGLTMVPTDVSGEEGTCSEGSGVFRETAKCHSCGYSRGERVVTI